MAKIENVVQAAITGALEVYCSQSGMPQLELFPPYAVQQGPQLRKFCADLVGRLNNSKIILLEIKELDCESGTLPAYDAKQHLDNILFEQLGVPLGYAYNAEMPLPYHLTSRPENWPEMTLKAVKRCLPSLLPHGIPTVKKHKTLFDWLQSLQGGNISAGLGRVHGAFKGAHNLRNGALVLLHAVDEQVLTSLTSEQLDEVITCLNTATWLEPKSQEKLKVLLGASAEVFSAFTTAPKPKPTKPAGHATKKKKVRGPK
ncbi:hypothetical protein N8H72_28765 [Pseudomonas koreensis]|uniref:hypothetical protein n=1 Tax=Pseudomonas koreensis TaxID=198620 RepID=UPI0021C5EC37|nr:hypothetical protein [Pseudomonas koreensis]MCU0093993.1 hypothetical protein [Pseudomonas koreensis]